MAGNKIFSLNLCLLLQRIKLEEGNSLLIILSKELKILKLNSKQQETQ